MKKNKNLGNMFFAAWDCDNTKWYTYQLMDMVKKLPFNKFSSFDPKAYLSLNGKGEMNKKFLELIKKEKPDYVFLWPMHEEFYLETLKNIRVISPKTITLCYNGDDDYKFSNYTMHFFPFIDYFLTTQPQYLVEYKKYNVPAFFSCGTDLDKFKPSKIKKEIEVSFVGTPKTDRLEFIKYLISKGIKLRVYGMGWDKYPELKEYYGGFLADEDFAELINKSKINICLSKNYIGGTHILERFFNINACKSFCLTEYATGYFPIFKEGEDIVTFKNKEELLNKIKYYLSHEEERQAVAEKAYAKTIKSFSTLKTLKDALTHIEADKKNKFGKYLSPINKKVIYLDENDLSNEKSYIFSLVNSYDYIGFKSKDAEHLDYKEYLQVTGLERTKMPISCCDNYLHSALVGDYASLCLYYAFDLKDKSYFYSNIDPAQLIVRKDFFLANLKKFANIYKNKELGFITKENTNFVSYPLVRLKRKTPLPLDNIDHVLFTYFDRDLLILKNQNRLYKTSYLPRLLFYSIFLNRLVLKLILKYTIARSRNKRLIKLSDFIKKRLFRIA